MQLQRIIMNSESEFEDTICWILREIKKESIATPDNENVYFEYQTPIDLIPQKEDQNKGLRYLQKEKAIKIIRPQYPKLFDLSITAEILGIKPIGYFLEILQPEFDEIYKKYDEIFKVKNKQIREIKIPDFFQINVRDREIWINDYLVGKPHAVGNNFEFFDYVRLKPANTKIEWKTIPDTAGYSAMKDEIDGRRFVKILNAIGFTGEITKAFFYKVGSDSLFYRGDKITQQDLQGAGVKMPLFLKQLEVAHLKNCPV